MTQRTTGNRRNQPFVVSSLIPMAVQIDPDNLNANGAYVSERLPVLRFPHKPVPFPSSQISSPENCLVAIDRSGVAIPLLLNKLVVQNACL